MIKNMKKPSLVCQDRSHGKLVVITGATAGVGYHTARKYAAMGSNVVMINRNRAKSERVQQELVQDFGVKVEFFIADLSVLAEIQKAGEYLAKIETLIDVLIHNAGIHLEKRQETPDGLETNFALHYLAPFIITHMVMEKLKRDQRGRVIFVGSEAYRFAPWGLDLEDLQWVRRRYSGIKAYGAGKIAQLLAMHRFAQELSPYGVTVNAMHPGTVRTESGKDNSKFYQWYKKQVIDKNSDSPDVSANALYYLGIAPELADTTDQFFHLTTQEELTPPALDMEAAENLWQATLYFLHSKGVTW
jgi:retinol dehydrogenase-13